MCLFIVASMFAFIVLSTIFACTSSYFCIKIRARLYTMLLTINLITTFIVCVCTSCIAKNIPQISHFHADVFPLFSSSISP